MNVVNLSNYLECLFFLINIANVNDRSMLGERDSEVAVIVEDNEMVSCYMYTGAQFEEVTRGSILKTFFTENYSENQLAQVC